jgi:hypothetical protein
MGGTCSTHGGNEKSIENFGQSPEGKGYDLERADGRIILNRILR